MIHPHVFVTRAPRELKLKQASHDRLRPDGLRAVQSGKSFQQEYSKYQDMIWPGRDSESRAGLSSIIIWMSQKKSLKNFLIHIFVWDQGTCVSLICRRILNIKTRCEWKGVWVVRRLVQLLILIPFLYICMVTKSSPARCLPFPSFSPFFSLPIFRSASP